MVLLERSHRRVGSVHSRSSELVHCHRRLHGDSGGWSDVQKVAAATALELVGARYGHPVRRGFDDLDDPGTRPAPVGPDDLSGDGLTRQRALHEDHATVVATRNTGPISRRCGHPEFHAPKRYRPTARLEPVPPIGAGRVALVHRDIEISPSILPADFARLGEECVALEAAGCDRIHWDVMDGVFVPNITVGPDVVKSLRPHLSIPFEAHLMVMEADAMAPLFVEAGCSTVMVHAEACTHLHRSLTNIRTLGAKSGVVLNPHTPAATIQHVLDAVDHILIMTVNPGFGGQQYIPLTDKIAEIKAMVDAGGHDIDIEIDGGISADTIGECAAAGANVFVSGSALFRYDDTAAGVAELKAKAEAARG